MTECLSIALGKEEAIFCFPEENCHSQKHKRTITINCTCTTFQALCEEPGLHESSCLTAPKNLMRKIYYLSPFYNQEKQHFSFHIHLKKSHTKLVSEA